MKVGKFKSYKVKIEQIALVELVDYTKLVDYD
jgi:hypothetical protein